MIVLVHTASFPRLGPVTVKIECLLFKQHHIYINDFHQVTCGVHNGFVHEEPEAHAPRPCCAVHLPRDKEGTVPGTPDVLPGNLRKVECEKRRSKVNNLRIADLHEEPSLRASCVISQWITTTVSRRRPLPVQLVNCVPSIRVAPAENVRNVDLCVTYSKIFHSVYSTMKKM